MYAVIELDYRKPKERGRKPHLESDVVVTCGGGNWHGKVEETLLEEREHRCPKCGNYIFSIGHPAESQYTFRIIDGEEKK